MEYKGRIDCSKQISRGRGQSDGFAGCGVNFKTSFMVPFSVLWLGSAVPRREVSSTQ
jgi:hypothetical protein